MNRSYASATELGSWMNPSSYLGGLSVSEVHSPGEDENVQQSHIRNQ
jgi:hypothetical protein